MEPEIETFAGALRALRTRRGLTINEVAEQLGVHHATVSRWESGKREPDRQDAVRLFGLYDVGVEEQVRITSLPQRVEAQLDASDDRAPVTPPPGLAAGASPFSDSDAVTAPTDSSARDDGAEAPGSAAPGRRPLSTPAADVSGRCTRCAGTGQVDGDDCAACESTGRIVAA